MLFREIFKDNKLIGLIGWDLKPEARGTTHNNQLILESFLSDIVIEEAQIASGMSFSFKKSVSIYNSDWIGYVDQMLPPEFEAGNVERINKKTFKNINL